MKYNISKNEVENILSVYWALLKEVEAHTNPNENVLNKHLVEDAYTVLNHSGIINSRPRWEK